MKPVLCFDCKFRIDCGFSNPHCLCTCSYGVTPLIHPITGRKKWPDAPRCIDVNEHLDCKHYCSNNWIKRLFKKVVK
jgi:hypothetical protein